MLSCPDCNGSEKVVLAGLRYVGDRKVQRYLCKICGYRFSEKTVINETGQKGSRQICATEQVMKNLTAKQKQKVLQGNGETKTLLISYSMQLLKDGKAEATIKTYISLLNTLNGFCDLLDPEAVKEVIATKYEDRNTKCLCVNAYDSFLKFTGGTWKKPKYHTEQKQVFIPTDKERYLAVNTGNRSFVFFKQFVDETGARVNEAERLEWTDIDSERQLVTIKASKNGNPRTLKVSENLIQLLTSLPRLSEKYVFKKRVKHSRSHSFHNQMQRLAASQNNPRFLKIHLHTLRHCKALREYHKTRTILHVMGVLGHKTITTTYRYLSLYNQIYSNIKTAKYVTKIASTKEERCDLINDGWDLVDKDGEEWYFRKPE